jgi:archaellum component FlaC
MNLYDLSSTGAHHNKLQELQERVKVLENLVRQMSDNMVLVGAALAQTTAQVEHLRTDVIALDRRTDPHQ